jgi:hypothetical protein
MLLRIGDRLNDETGEYEIIGRPYTTKRISVKRATAAEDKG